MERSSNLLDEALGLNHHQHQHQHQYQHLGVSTIPGRVVLIEDRVETSGAFVLHHFIKRALSFDNLGVVIFVSLAYHFSHYERILKKLGCNLGSQKESGRFLFFDMLKLECPGERIRYNHSF
ncbi:hypothetical protein GIB67_018536 [Kingdonia uniflora]|uniref:Elongator complex protein 6 n=1 Tax=Kingdonia uniflora TaxID=39325 RepID=A0A7J7LW63_9MAGN|nr:hypothetical protein GIB67_018536 [Kingdonia uniflora]